ncbi:hypothetical protein [Mycobacterium noviomagense]|uniref:Uncharacterized protein n=1 Tax=Mycobacterium noviomagense TaxID=459858 RepID=A0A7I7PCX0_9MYCO|nr:hypothetical protein [Mycobacterium noviomagense]BBY06345.1 hypothetical protein MNVI_16630 [Mycobacterium noviomagense]
MTIYVALALAAEVIGRLIGRSAIIAARRGAVNPEQAARRRYAVLFAFPVFAAGS